MTQWATWDRLMAEDEERRVRIARYQAAQSVRQSTPGHQPKPIAALIPVQRPPLRPNEGVVSRTAGESITVVYYGPGDIERLANRTPWLLAELMAELEQPAQ